MFKRTSTAVGLLLLGLLLGLGAIEMSASWTTPKTWTATVVSVSDLNTHLRDNLNALTDTTSTITTTGNQSALAIPDGRGDLVIVANNASLLTIQGIAVGQDGQTLAIVSKGAGQVDISHQDAGAAAAANKIICFATTGKTSLAAGVGVAVLRYDTTRSRWVLITHEQGDTIDYSSTSTITGFTGALTHQQVRYWLRGRDLWANVYLEGTSNATTLTFTLPFTSVNDDSGITETAVQAEDNTVVLTTPGLLRLLNNSATVSGFKDTSAAAWTNSGTKRVLGAFGPIRVQ